MDFIRHPELRGKHALLAPSQPQWLRYTEEQLDQRYVSKYAQDIGTYLHELAETLINNRVKLKKTDKNVIVAHLLGKGIPMNAIDVDRIFNNFRLYVEDAIGFRLQPEVVLKYSEHCFGTADAINFDKNVLRIHDYKSGVMPAKIEQLLVYAALFCLEYRIKPGEIKIILVIYQGDEPRQHEPEADEILPIMDTIVRHSNYLDEMNKEV